MRATTRCCAGERSYQGRHGLVEAGRVARVGVRVACREVGREVGLGAGLGVGLGGLPAAALGVGQAGAGRAVGALCGRECGKGGKGRAARGHMGTTAHRAARKARSGTRQDLLGARGGGGPRPPRGGGGGGADMLGSGCGGGEPRGHASTWCNGTGRRLPMLLRRTAGLGRKTGTPGVTVLSVRKTRRRNQRNGRQCTQPGAACVRLRQDRVAGEAVTLRE